MNCVLNEGGGSLFESREVLPVDPFRMAENWSTQCLTLFSKSQGTTGDGQTKSEVVFDSSVWMVTAAASHPRWKPNRIAKESTTSCRTALVILGWRERPALRTLPQ